MADASKMYTPTEERKKKTSTAEVASGQNENTDSDESKSDDEFLGRRVRKPLDASHSIEDELLHHIDLYMPDVFDVILGI